METDTSLDNDIFQRAGLVQGMAVFGFALASMVVAKVRDGVAFGRSRSFSSAGQHANML